MQHDFDSTVDLTNSPPKVAKLTHTLDDVILDAKAITTFAEFSKIVVAQFNRGFVLRKAEGHASITGHDGRAMQLIARLAGQFWDDSDRIEGTVFAKGTTVDTFLSFLAKEGIEPTYDYLSKNRAISISDTAGTYVSKILSMQAQKIMVLVNVGKGVKAEDRSVPLYSSSFWNAWARFYRAAGGIFTPPTRLTLTYPTDANDEVCAATRIEFNTYIAMMDDNLLSPGESWDHEDARGWAIDGWNNGLKKDTPIAVNARFHIVPDEASVAVVSNTFDTELMKTTFTSSGHYSMSFGKTCYSNTKDQVRKASGIWSKNEETEKLDMRGIKLAASNMDFTKASVEAMNVKQDEVKKEMDLEMVAVKEDDLPPPSSALYPFVDNKELKGVFVAVLSHGVRKRPVLRNNTYRGGDVIGSSYSQSKGMSRSVTRGCGGGSALTRKRAPSPPPEASSEPVKACSDIKYPKIGVGVKLFEMEGMPAYDSNKEQMLRPSFTLMNVLVWKKDGRELTVEEEEAESLELMDAVAQQIKDFDAMAKACVQASISAIHESKDHLVKKADMTDHDLVALTATKKINASLSDFFDV